MSHLFLLSISQYFCVNLHTNTNSNLMKKTLLCLLIASTMLTACNSGGGRHENLFDSPIREGRQCMFVYGAEDFYPGDGPLGVDNCYRLEWPESGMLSPEAEAEVLQRCFGDNSATSFKQAADNWLNNVWMYGNEDVKIRTEIVDSLGDLENYNYAKKESTITYDNNLATMLITTETMAAYAAHGLYTVEYIVMDIDTKKIVHLNDLIDTAKLGEVIIRAIEDLDVNKDTRDCLFDEYRTAGRVAVPQDFFIDSTRSVINLVFQQYDITPYACGIQTVSLPIFWLSKHIPLTPYCKDLCVPGCAIE